MLEARDRVGGRVEQIRIDDGRPVQLGGEVVGLVHTSYLALVEELGLTIEPSYVGVTGSTTYGLFGELTRGDAWPFGTESERADYERVERLFGELVATVDPDDPWSHPDASRLDDLSFGAVAPQPSTRCPPSSGRSRWARWRWPPARSSTPRCSPSSARPRPSETPSFYSYDLWESLQVVGGKRRGGRAARGRPRRAGIGSAPRSHRGRGHPNAAASSRLVRRRGAALGGGRLRAPDRRARREIEIEGVPAGAARVAPPPAHALAAKVVAVYDSPSGATSAATGSARASTCSGRRGRSATACSPGSCRPSASACSSRWPSADREQVIRDELGRLFGEPLARDTRDAPPSPVGHRSVHARLRDALVARRRAARRPAARHARAAVLRLRLRPVGGRLHGGRRPHRSRSGGRGTRFSVARTGYLRRFRAAASAVGHSSPCQ